MWKYKLIPSCISAYVYMELHSRMTHGTHYITNILHDRSVRFMGCGYPSQIWIEVDDNSDISAPVHYEEFSCRGCPYWLYGKEWYA